MTSPSDGSVVVVELVLPGVVVVLVEVDTRVDELVVLDVLVLDEVELDVASVLVVVVVGAGAAVVDVVGAAVVVVGASDVVVVVVGASSTAVKRNFNFFALSVPSIREQPSTILAMSRTLPVSVAQASHRAFRFVTPLRLPWKRLGVIAAQIGSSDTGEPATTTENGAPVVVTT